LSPIKSEIDKVRREVSQLAKKLERLERTPRDIEKIGDVVSTVSGSLGALEEKVSDATGSLVSSDRFDREIYGIKRISEKFEKEADKDRKGVRSSIASLESSLRSMKETVSSLEGTLKDEVAAQLASGEERVNAILSEGKEKLDAVGSLKEEMKRTTERISRNDALIQAIDKKRNEDASKAEKLISSLVSDFTQKESEKSSKKLHSDLKAVMESDVDDGLKSLEKSIGEMRDKVMADTRSLVQKEAERQRNDLLKLSKSEIDEMGRNALESIRQMFREEELRALKSLEEEASEKTNRAIRAKLDLLREEIVNDVRVAVAKEDAVRINDISKIAKRDVEDEMDKAAEKIRLSVLRDVEDQRGKLGRDLLSELSRIAEKDINAKMELFHEKQRGSVSQEIGRMKDDVHSGVLESMKKELKADRESLELAARNSFDVFRNETYSRLTQASNTMKDEWEGLKKSFEKDASSTLRAFELDFQNRAADKLDSIVDRKLKSEFIGIKDAVTADVKQFSVEILNSGLQKNSEKSRDLISDEAKKIESKVRAEIVERVGESVSLRLAKMEKDLEKSSGDHIDAALEKRLRSELNSMKEVALGESRVFASELVEDGKRKLMEKLRGIAAEEISKSESILRSQISDRVNEAISSRLIQAEKDLEKSAGSRVGDVERRLSSLENDIWKRIEQDFRETERKVIEHYMKQKDTVSELSAEIRTINESVLKAVDSSLANEFSQMKSDILQQAKKEMEDSARKITIQLDAEIRRKASEESERLSKSLASLKAGYLELEDKFGKVHERASRDAALIVEKRIGEVERRTIENISSIVLDINNALEKKIDSKINEGLPGLGEELRNALRQELFQGLGDENKKRLDEMEDQIEHLAKRGASKYEDELKDIEKRIRGDLESARKEGADIKDSLEERIEIARKEALNLRDSVDNRFSNAKKDLEDVLGSRLKEIYVDMDRKISDKIGNEKKEKNRLKEILDEFDAGK
ncbi:MAG: hypothetical protein HZB68_04415, partial [Candidatus Aenigmarchaeota archaeon]|nr:hypothetical protein [Candidatus Aenigmarchaeota archaeon]